MRKILNFFKKPEPVAPTEPAPEKPIYDGETLIYTAKDGTKYYACPPEKLDNSRKVLLNIKLQEIDFGISGKELLAGLEQLEKDLTSLGPGKDYHEFRLKMLRFLANAAERTSRILNGDFELAACGLLFRHEDEPFAYSGFWARRKFKLWEEDEETKYFFLALFLREFRNLPKASPESVREYLQSQELKNLVSKRKEKD